MIVGGEIIITGNVIEKVDIDVCLFICRYPMFNPPYDIHFYLWILL